MPRMYRIAALVIALLFTGAMAFPQAQPQVLNLSTPSPSGVLPTTVSGRPVNPTPIGPGTPIYYWVVARFPSGLSIPTGPVTVTGTVGLANLTVSNYVALSWSSAPGATGYDVIHNSSTTYPGSSCASCAVVLNTTALSVNDQSPTGSAYPPGGTNPAPSGSSQTWLDTKSYGTPNNVRMVTNINGTTYLDALFSGTFANTDCLQYTNGYITSTGAPCGSGSGGIDVQDNAGASLAGGPFTTIRMQNGTNTTWTLTNLGGGVAGLAPNSSGTVAGCAVTSTTTTVTITTPCTVTVNSVPYTLGASAVFTLASGGGTGTIYVYGSTDGTTSQLTIGLFNVTGTPSCNANCTTVTLGSSGFPTDPAKGAAPIAQVAVTAGSIGAVTNRAPVSVGVGLVAGTNIGLTPLAGGAVQIDNTASSGGGIVSQTDTTPAAAVACTAASWVTVDSLTVSGIATGSTIEYWARLTPVTSTNTANIRATLDGIDIENTGGFGAVTCNTGENCIIAGRIFISPSSITTLVQSVRPNNGTNVGVRNVSGTPAASSTLAFQVNCAATGNTYQMGQMTSKIYQ